MTLKSLFLGLLLISCGALRSFASAPEATWAAPATKLAAEIAGISGPGTASLSLRNQSAISADDLPAIRRALEAQLRVHGVQVRSEENAATAITVTLSENLEGWLWVAEVGQGSEVKTALVEIPRPANAAVTQGGPSISLKKVLVFSQENPMLDFATIRTGSETHLVVLDGNAVSLYRSIGSKFELEQAFPITKASPYPRDLRGRLTIGKDHLFDAYLPGIICASSVSSPITVNCRESDDPWALGSQRALYNAARNYFTGVLLPGTGKPLSPFFTIGDVPRSNYTLWIYTGIDGVVRESDGMNERRAPGPTSDWGSDLAAVHDACGLGTQVLVTAAGDVADSIRAYELPDREPVQVSAPLDFDHPVTALWSSVDGTTANAVVRDTAGGRYEAYSVSVACGQ